MKVKYVRVSTLNQNPERQTDFNGTIYTDTCSGNIAFKERPAASKLMNDDSITEVSVHSIDRLGRNTLDIMQTIQYFTDNNINVVSTKEGLQTIVNGKENPVAKMMIGILGTLAEFELSRIKERQSEGIAKAKLKGTYTGRPSNTSESIETFLSKQTTKDVIKYLNEGYSIDKTAKLSSCSTGKVKKVKRLIREGVI